MRYSLAVLIWCAVAGMVEGASAQDVPVRDMQVSWSRGTPRVSFSAKDLANEQVRKELKSALRKRMVVRVSAQLGGRVIAEREFGCDVTRDLWDDGYLVRIAGRTERLPSLDQALNRCLVVRGLFVGDDPERYRAHRDQNIFFLVTAEFNPISDRQCRELIRPTGSDDPIGPITVSIVRRRICQAERTIVFRSKNVRVPP